MGNHYVGQVDSEALTEQFFRLLEAGDADGAAAMFADDAAFWKNNDAALDPAAFRQHVAGIFAQGITVTYESVRRIVTSDAVVDQHVARMKHPGGQEATGSACVILRFDNDGMIVRLDEYIDGTPFVPLFT